MSLAYLCEKNLILFKCNLNIIDPLISPLLSFFNFLPCSEKAYDNKQFGRENLEARHES